MALNNSYAQVGIGNVSPDSTSILDLTNTDNRGLVLPSSATASAMSSSEKTIYFFNNYLYFKTSNGYNAFSPWKYRFNGNTSNNLYFDLLGNIGIGSSNITTSPEAPLQIETENSVDLTSNGSLLIGISSGLNMVMNSSEIQSRNGGLASDLKINEDGGNVVFGDVTIPVDVKVTGKVQELDQATNTYYDLIPPGIITAWFGLSSNIPVGWAICDGGTYPSSDGVDSTTTPDLKGRFIVSVGDNGSNSYIANDIGGEDLVSLTVNEIPNHSHNTRTTGAHSHIYSYDDTKNTYQTFLGARSAIDETSESGTNHGSVSTGYANIYQGSGGSNQAHENRPVYYSLVYIMKL